MVAEDIWRGKSKLKPNSAQLELELGLSLAIIVMFSKYNLSLSKTVLCLDLYQSSLVVMLYGTLLEVF